MKVKSFVNGLDPENTVKGYYDENDQLVMVEPEGSGGGGGDFTTAKLTIAGAPPAGQYLNVVNVNDEEMNFGIPMIPGVYDIVLYKGVAGSESFSDISMYDLTGSAELDVDTIVFTGDATLTYKGDK